MFSLQIADSDAFLDMPISAQCLYFHLGMRADDDGFVSPKRISRMLGTSTDDLGILIAKRFVLAFESGVVVIKHWPNNNLIRKDRYTDTNYKHEKATLGLNENGSYTEKENAVTQITGVVNERLTKGKPNVIPVVNPGKVRLGKDRLGKDSIELSKDRAETTEYGKQELNNLFSHWESIIGYPITSKKQQNRNACSNLYKKYGTDGVVKLIRGVEMSSKDQYAPRVSDFISLQAKLNDLMAWGNKNNNKNTIMEI